METSLKCEGLFGLLANSEGLERVSGLAFMLTMIVSGAPCVYIWAGARGPLACWPRLAGSAALFGILRHRSGYAPAVK